MQFNILVLSVLLALPSVLLAAPSSPNPMNNIFDRAPLPNCSKNLVVIALKALKAEQFCTEFLGYTSTAIISTTVTNTATSLTTFTPAPIFTTSTATTLTTTTVTTTIAPINTDPPERRDNLEARTGGRPVIPAALKSYASSVISSACSCIATPPSSTQTSTATSTQTITQTLPTLVITQTGSATSVITATATAIGCTPQVVEISRTLTARNCGPVPATFRYVYGLSPAQPGNINTCRLNCAGNPTQCNSWIYRAPTNDEFDACYFSLVPTAPTAQDECASGGSIAVDSTARGFKRCT